MKIIFVLLRDCVHNVKTETKKDNMTDTKLKEDESLLYEKYELRLYNHPVLVLKTVRGRSSE